MIAEGQGILAWMDAPDEAISLAWAQAIAIAFRSHKKAGVPIATWDSEMRRVVLISPDQISIPGEDHPEPLVSHREK